MASLKVMSWNSITARNHVEMLYRVKRVNQLFRQELSNLIAHEAKDPRLDSLLSITEVDTAPDLKSAKVYVSHVRPDADRAEIITSLRSAAGFLKNELGHRLELRYFPELTFFWDDSIERGGRIIELIDRLHDKKD